jgi:hypothetical protein
MLLDAIAQDQHQREMVPWRYYSSRLLKDEIAVRVLGGHVGPFQFRHLPRNNRYVWSARVPDSKIHVKVGRHRGRRDYRRTNGDADMRIGVTVVGRSELAWRLPLVGPVDAMKGVYSCAGFNSHGMGFAFMSAKRLSDSL